MHAHRFVNIFLMIVATMALVVAVILLRARTPETALESDSRQTQLPPALNVLLVGIDRRFSADREHCDAIHMIRVDVEGERVDIVNVPRGTRWPFEMPDDWVPEAELYALAAQRLEARKAAAPVEEDNAPLAADAAATTSDIDSIVAEA